MQRSFVIVAAIAVVVILVGSLYIEGVPPFSKGASGSTNPTTSMSASTSLSTGTKSTGSSGTTSTPVGEAWTTYHADNARTGYLPISNFTLVTAGWTSQKLDGSIYTEPLVYQGDVFVATENDSVYALDAQTGVVAWQRNLGPPVLANTLPCGDIGPVTGITGTPVIDPSTGTLFVVSYSGTSFSHVLSAINASTGAVLWQRGADPPGATVSAQQERSALSVANGMVYIPYGGLAGDCAQYYGWVVGLPENDSGSMDVYQVPTQREGGIWAPSGLAIDSTGDVYVATGNGASNTVYDYGDSVIKLSPTLKILGYFAPTEWSQLNQADADLGSLGPAIVGPGTLFQIGKSGVGYLLNTQALGGIGGQVFDTSVCGESFGGTAFAAPYIFVPCTNGLYVLKFSGTSFATALDIGGLNAGPPIVTGGIAWTVDSNSGTLFGLSTATGHQAYTFPLGSVEHFTGPSAGDGQVFVAGTDKVMSFVLG